MGIKLFSKNVMKVFVAAFMTFIVAGCTPPSEPHEDVTVMVQGYDGALLNGATVTINEVSGVANEDGVVVLNIISPEEDEIVVKASVDGFVNQSVTATLSDETTVLVTMHQVKEVLTIANIETAQEIQGESLGAHISLPANSLVKPDGSLAEGNVTLHLTPWDVQNNELGAMPGNAQAIDAEGNRVELISAGMMSVSFYDSEGNYLQLASGVTAEILMDLTQLSINNQALTVGDTIPLWHFDENQGLWIEDGTGVVVASDSSSTGMAISATVTHFSTWNWDFKFQNAGSVDVSCISPDGAVECSVTAYVTLDDGSTFTKSHNIPVEGAHVINMPTTGTITWEASTATGLIGTQISGTTGTVTIVVGEPTTENFVQCDVNGTAVPCTVTLANPSGDDIVRFIPATGATIKTLIDGASSLSWSGTSRKMIEDDTVVHYEGSIVSGISGTVTIPLDTRVEYGTAAQTIFLKCTNPDSLPITTCDISVWVYKEDYTSASTYYTDIPIGSTVVYTIPNGSLPNDSFYFSANSQDINATDDYYGDFYGGGYYYGNESSIYSDLVNNQVIEIEMYEGPMPQ